MADGNVTMVGSPRVLMLSVHVCVYNFYVRGSKRNTMKNSNVSHSKWSGLCVRYGLMTIDGNATTIHHNSTGGGGCGLLTSSSSSIVLASPLTKETISTNNGVGRNYKNDTNAWQRFFIFFFFH